MKINQKRKNEEITFRLSQNPKKTNTDLENIFVSMQVLLLFI